MEFRAIQPSDLEQSLTLWREAGWAHSDQAAAHREMLELFIALGHGQVALHEGELVAQALSAQAVMAHGPDEIPLTVVSAVNTAQQARKRGLAGRLTAALLAEAAEAGAVGAILGMFEQGFYDRLGFGSGPAGHIAQFDPRSLRREFTCRIPRRLTLEDAPAMYAARTTRLRCHGRVSLTDPRAMRAGMLENSDGFGFGYFDGPAGEFTHGFWAGARDQEFGPYDIHFMIYQTPAQFHELLGLLRTFSDQVYSFVLFTPPQVQWQDLLDEPFRRRRIARGGAHPTEIRMLTWWQMRLLDLPGALAQTHLTGRSLTFQLELSDPIAGLVPPGAAWRGCAGEWIVTLGPECRAVAGRQESLPVLRTSVNAFSRLWVGARSAMGLQLTDDFVASPELVASLDETVRLPEPHVDWGF